MELQFHKSACSCMQKLTAQVQTQEQTQEIRIPDGMPDIGRVLGAWGQGLIRSKEWRGAGMSVSGGVMVSVMYMPEDGSGVRCVEGWVPFQMKWEFPDPGRDGTIRAACLLRGVDARSTSARKLMVRAGISVLGEAYVPGQTELYVPGELPEDVQLLRRTYPMRLPAEAGEKPFMLEEELTLPASCPKLHKIIRYSLHPELIDQKVMASKVVFRGVAILHVLYSCEDGGVHSWDFEIPFSQFTELDTDYDQDSSVSILPAVTSLELEAGEGDGLILKAGLTGQYIVRDMRVIEVVEDAYSAYRPIQPQIERLELPVVLEEKNQTMRVEQVGDMTVEQIADIAFYPDAPGLYRDPEGVNAELGGVFQMLYYDPEGNLQGSALRWSDVLMLPADPDSRVEMTVWPSGTPQLLANGADTILRADILMEMVTAARQGMPMVTGLSLGEITEPDPDRPSVIVRRAGDASLWDIAKESGSTVTAIENANGLQGEPEYGQMLLIPVL